MSRACNDLVSINPLCDLVTFEDIPENYSPDRDIFVIYQLGQSFVPTSKDWVGLYRHGWSDIHKYIAFQWSPKKPRNEKHSRIRSVMFLASRDLKGLKINGPANINNDGSSDLYQFLYVAKGSHIVGVSRRFTISNIDHSLLHCVDRKLDNIGSLTFVEVDRPKSPTSPPSDQSMTHELEDEYDLLTSSDSETETTDNPASSKIIDLEMVTKNTKNKEDENKERSLVPWQKWEVVPAQQPGLAATSDQLINPVTTKKLVQISKPVNIDAIPDSLFNQMKDILCQIRSQCHIERPLTVQVPHCALPLKPCKQCRAKRLTIEKIRSRNKKLEKDVRKTNADLANTTEMLEMKEWLTVALSDQVKQLVAENSTLRVMKERLESAAKNNAKTCKRCSRMWNKFNNMTAENHNLKQNLLDATNDLHQVKSEKDSLELACKHSEDSLREKCVELEKDLAQLNSTLSKRGVERVRAEKSDDSETSSSGWCTVFGSRKRSQIEVMHQGIVAMLNEQIHKLESSINDLVEDVESTKVKLEAKNVEFNSLDGDQKNLKVENDDLMNKIDSLEHGLVSIQRKKSEQARKHREKESALSERISSLTAALENAHLNQRQNRPKLSVQEQPTRSYHDDFSFSDLFKAGLESLAKSFDSEHDSHRKPLIEPLPESPLSCATAIVDENNNPIVDELVSVVTDDGLVQVTQPPLLFPDFFPTALPEPSFSAVPARWSTRTKQTSTRPSKPDIEMRDITGLGKACGKHKITFDFRKELDGVLNATEIPEQIESTHAAPIVVAEPELRPVWQTLPKLKTTENEQDFPLLKSPSYNKNRAGEKPKLSLRSHCEPKLKKTKRQPLKFNLKSRKETCMKHGQDVAGTSIVCPYCQFSFPDDAGLAVISQHIDKHNQVFQ